MSRSVAAGSSFSSRAVWQATRASFLAKSREHLVLNGAAGYILVRVVLPVFTLVTIGLLYRDRGPTLLGYAVVGVTASAFITNSLYYVGQILDEERMEGTLINLFLAPAPRLTWLTGFAFGGLVDTLASAICTLTVGILAFGVRFQTNVPALVLSFVLFILSLWGMGFVFSAAGLILKRSNDLANLLSSVITLLGGIYYPVDALPTPLRQVAELLPFGYGIKALANASLHDAPIGALIPQLLPLAIFAAVLPVFGLLAFRSIEHKVRMRGDLDLY